MNHWEENTLREIEKRTNPSQFFINKIKPEKIKTVITKE